MVLLAVKKVVQGRISIEDFSHYLVARIQNCRLLKCHLRSFSLSLHVLNYHFLCHILLFPFSLRLLCHSPSVQVCVAKAKSDIIANLSISVFLCLIKISQRNSISDCCHSGVIDMEHSKAAVTNNVYFTAILSSDYICVLLHSFLCLFLSGVQVFYSLL